MHRAVVENAWAGALSLSLPINGLGIKQRTTLLVGHCSVGMAIPLTCSRISLALWLYRYRENTLPGTPGSFAKLKFSCVRLGGEGTSNELFFSVTKLKANLTNVMHGCCGRASREELVLLDASHKTKAAHAEPGPEVMDTRSFRRRHPSARAGCRLHGDQTCGLTDVGQSSSPTVLDTHCVDGCGTADQKGLQSVGSEVEEGESSSAVPVEGNG